MSVFRAVAWDIDGTLIDSEGLHQRSLIETGAEFGVDLSDLPDEAFRGIHMRDVWTALQPRFPEDSRPARRGSRRSSASMSPTRRRSQPSPARWNGPRAGGEGRRSGLRVEFRPLDR